MRTDNVLNLLTGLNVGFKNSSPLLYMSFLTAAAEKRLFFWCLLGSRFEPERLLFYYFIGKWVIILLFYYFTDITLLHYCCCGRGSITISY